MGRIFTLNGINQELLRGTNGDDIVQGSRARPWVWNGRRGVIRLRKGNDRIQSSSFVRIRGEIALGGGRDLITGQTVSLLAFQKFNGNVDMGRGRDRIHASSGALILGEDSELRMGDGNDFIGADQIGLAGGLICAGRGDDLIDVGDGSISAPYFGRLDLGPNNDVLIARGGIVLFDGGGVWMGPGDDLIDVRNGGIDNFESGGAINLGPGNDKIIGFAAIPDPTLPIDTGGFTVGGVVGGKGKDTIVLQEGVYEVSNDRISTAETFLPVAGINYLEGINGGRFAFEPGILTVNDQGAASFSAGL